MSGNTHVTLYRNLLRFCVNAFGGKASFFSLVDAIQRGSPPFDLLAEAGRKHELPMATLSWNIRLEERDIAALMVFVLNAQNSANMRDIGDEEWESAFRILDRVEFTLQSKHDKTAIAFGIFGSLHKDEGDGPIFRFGETFLSLFVLSPLISNLVLQQRIDNPSIVDLIRERDLVLLDEWHRANPADINGKEDDTSFASNPLSFAAEDNWSAGADFLISAGAEVNVRDWRNWTPLLYALANSNHQLARQLLIAGAEPLLGQWRMAMFSLNRKRADKEEYLAYIAGFDIN